MVNFIEVVVKVAIIGAGISGIGSSLEFSKNGVEHIIIQARNRTGGRITSTVFDGVTVQLGAEAISTAKKHNLISDIIRKEGWQYQQILLFQNSSLVQPGRGELSQTAVKQANKIRRDLARKVKKQQAHKSQEGDMLSAVDHYFAKITNNTVEVDIAKWQCYYIGQFRAADLQTLGDHIFYTEIKNVDWRAFYLKKGYSYFVQSIFQKATPKKVYLNTKVTKIDYSGKQVKIYTQNKVFRAQKVILTLPLGVLKQNNVQFIPKLSEERKEAIQKLGFGVFNKIFVSFETPFWNTQKLWHGFVTKNGKSKYLLARYISDNGKFILCFYVYASDAVSISKMSDEQIKGDISKYLAEFYPNATIVVKDLTMARWNEDPFALGSYFHQVVNTDAQKLSKTICKPLDNKVWFAGQHCYAAQFAESYQAFQTGFVAARRLLRS